MANTFTQLYIHIIFAVKHRGCALSPQWRENLYAYIGGVMSNLNSPPILIGGTEDHVHILASVNKNITIPTLLREVKTSATSWINSNHLNRNHFEWQSGYGAFTVSPSVINSLKKYIANQVEHHRHKTFLEEYCEFLKAYGIDYAPPYLPYNPLDKSD